MKKIAVVGVGQVGLVTGACLANLGNSVICIDIDEEKIGKLRQGEPPFHEPGLSELMQPNIKAERLLFTTSYAEALADIEFVFICVGTPNSVDGETDLRYVRMAAESIARAMRRPLIVVSKSTVPVGAGDWVADSIQRNQPTPIDFSVVSCPEFLKAGSAIADFMNPDRVVLGSLNQAAVERVAQLYLPLGAPIVATDLRTAEMIKYASNAFLATRISFINEIAAICEKLGANVQEVAAGIGYDRRIGPHFLNAGLGYGGSCLPKDVKALEHTALMYGVHSSLLRAVAEINQNARRWALLTLRTLLGGYLVDKKIGILGLAFKPDTDDLRHSPALEIIHLLQIEGALVSGYDPVAMPGAANLNQDLRLREDPYDLADGMDALLVCTEWDEFRQLDMPRIKNLMARPILVDGRNIYNISTMEALGFIYRSVGRGHTTNQNPGIADVSPAMGATINESR